MQKSLIKYTRFSAVLLITYGLLYFFGCTLAQVDVNVVSERTSLENQVLGTYNSLDREMLLTSSVRGVDTKGNIKQPPRRSQELMDVISAMQLLDFYKDDIDRLKQMKWLGENNQGFLDIRSTDKSIVPEAYVSFSQTYSEEEFRDMVEKANEARKAIMGRVIVVNENLSEKDMPEICRVFGNLNADNALPGELVQTQDGKWIEK